MIVVYHMGIKMLASTKQQRKRTEGNRKRRLVSHQFLSAVSESSFGSFGSMGYHEDRFGLWEWASSNLAGHQTEGPVVSHHVCGQEAPGYDDPDRYWAWCRARGGVYAGESRSSSHLEWEAAGESSSAARLAAAEGVTTGRSEAATAAAIHHVEEDVGVDVDMGAVHATHTTHATHSSHSTHTAHASHASEATAAEHVSGVNEVISIVVGSAFSRKR